MSRAGLALGSVLIGISTVAVAAGDEMSQLRLSLEPDAQEIVPFEPLGAIVRLKNIGDKPVAHYGVPIREWRFFVSYEGGPFEEAGRGRFSGIVCGPDAPLEPGQEVRSDEVLLWNQKQADNESAAFVFRHPGAYRVQVRLGEGSRLIESSPIRVAVKDFSPADAAVVHLLARKSVARLLLGYANDDREAAPISFRKSSTGPRVGIRRSRALRARQLLSPSVGPVAKRS